MHRFLGIENGLPVYSRDGGTSQIEGIVNQKLGQSISWNMGARLLHDNISQFCHAINIKSTIKNDPNFQWIGYNGYHEIEQLQELHRHCYDVSYPFWFESSRSYIPVTEEYFGFQPIESDIFNLQDPRLKGLTGDDKFLALKQKSLVS